MRQLGAELDEHNMSKQPLTAADVAHILDAVGSVQGALNVYNKTVRARGWKDDPPTREAFIAAVAGDNNLIRRPILIAGDRVVVGRDEAAYQEIYG